MALCMKPLGRNVVRRCLRPCAFPCLSANPSSISSISRDFVPRPSLYSDYFFFACRNLAAPAQELPADASEEGINAESKKSSEISLHNDPENKKKPLDVFFKEAIGLVQRSGVTELSDGGFEDDTKSIENGSMIKRLKVLEREVRNLKSILNAKTTDKNGAFGMVEAKPNRLYSLFARSSAEKKGTESLQEKASLFSPEELSPEMLLFIDLLFKEGYLVDGNFSKDGKLNLNCLSSSFSQDYLQFAAKSFAEEHQETAKWLSGGELKKVALFGCPSVERKTVFAAKSLRSFFSVHEDTVCQACKLKSSCKFANQRVIKRKKLILTDALRVLTSYGLESLPKQLVLTDEMRDSISKLLKQVVQLSR